MSETERAGGYGSPISLFLGRNVRSPLPNSENRKIDVQANLKKKEERVEKWASKKNKQYNRESLDIGDKVVIKDNKSGKWNVSGVIIDARHSVLTRNGNKAPVTPKDARSVIIAADNGGQYLCNKRFVKKQTYDD